MGALRSEHDERRALRGAAEGRDSRPAPHRSGDRGAASGSGVQPRRGHGGGFGLRRPRGGWSVGRRFRRRRSGRILGRSNLAGATCWARSRREAPTQYVGDGRLGLDTMLTTTASMSRYPIFLAVTEEGGEGTVAKSAISVADVKTFAEMAETGDSSVARSAGSEMGSYLSELGINVNLAPSANLDGKSHSFGTDSTQAASCVAALVEGLEGSEVSACLKTFPGIVSEADTEQGLASIQSDTDQLRAEEFPIFQAGIDAGADFVMVGHLSVPGITGDNTPCTLSEKMITEILRGQMGFDGVVITDSMAMSAITDYYTADEAAVKALQAGADMILMPEDFETAYQGVLDAVNNGTLTEDRINESLVRIYRVKLKDRAS